MASENDKNSSSLYGDADYHPLYTNWYTSRPYGFTFTPKDGQAMQIYLPINPNNLSISTPFATNIVPTLYGTVEEHSAVRYYDINIEGTTGMGPKWVLPSKAGYAYSSAGRAAFTVKGALDNIPILGQSGLFKNTLETAGNVIDGAKSLGVNDESTGLKLDQTGYLAFHNLYRFLLKYKKDVCSDKPFAEGAPHPLIFFNRKDNNKYRVAVKAMTMRRDKEDPMMYHYAISMRGYDLSPATNITAQGSSIGTRLADLGLDGVSGASYLQIAKKKADQAKSILASVSTGVNQLGR